MKDMGFEEWMKEVKNIDVTILRMHSSRWDKYLDEYNKYRKELFQANNNAYRKANL